MSDQQDESGDWEVPSDAAKQLKLSVRPGDDYPLALQIVHKEDALGTQAGLTIQQAAILHHQLGEFLDELDDPPNVRSRTVEPPEDTGRGYE